ncbi:MAG: hypothetical protein ACQEW9_03500 [Bacteroidota bacterium]
MKFPSYFLSVVLLVALVSFWQPYWVVMIVIFAFGILITSRKATSFWGGGLGMAVAWLGQGVFISIKTGGKLADKIADIFGVSSGLWMLMLTVLLGFLLGSFSALSSNLLRKILKRERKDIYRGPLL